MNNQEEHNLWWAKYSPLSLEHYIGNPIFKADLEEWIKDESIPNIILVGRAGSGKTAAAKLITHNIDCDSLYINASDENGIETIREKVKTFASAASFKNQKIIVLDEADFLTVNAQAALRNIVEAFSQGTRFIFTCNYYEKMLYPIRSRLEKYELDPPTKGELAQKCSYILKEENIKFELTEIKKLVELTYPDIRQTLIKLQSYSKKGELIVTDSSTNLHKVSDELIKQLKSKSFSKVRQIIIDLALKDYTEVYTLLSDKLDEYTDNVTIPWFIAESLFQSVSIPDKQICILGLMSKIISTK